MTLVKGVEILAITLIGLRRLNLLERQLGRSCRITTKSDERVYLGDWIDEVVSKVYKSKGFIENCRSSSAPNLTFEDIQGLDELKKIITFNVDCTALVFYEGILVAYKPNEKLSKENNQILKYTNKIDEKHFRSEYSVASISTSIEYNHHITFENTVSIWCTYSICHAIEKDRRLTEEEADKLGINSIKRVDSPKERELRKEKALKMFEEIEADVKRAKEEARYNSEWGKKDRKFKEILAEKHRIEESMLKEIEDNDLHVYVRWLEDAEACHWKSVYPGDKDNEDLAIIELETRKHPIVNVPEYKLAKEAVAMVNNMLRRYYPVLKEARAYAKMTRHKSYQLGCVDMRTGRGMYGFEFNIWKTDERTHQNNVKLLYLQNCAEAYYGQHGIAFNGYHATGVKSRKYLKKLRSE